MITGFSYGACGGASAGAALPGDACEVSCGVRDPEGKAVTVSIRQTSGQGCLFLTSGCLDPAEQTFSAGETRGGVVFHADYGSDSETVAMLECAAVDSAGEKAAPRRLCIRVGFVECP